MLAFPSTENARSSSDATTRVRHQSFFSLDGCLMRLTTKFLREREHWTKKSNNYCYQSGLQDTGPAECFCEST